LNLHPNFVSLGKPVGQLALKTKKEEQKQKIINAVSAFLKKEIDKNKQKHFLKFLAEGNKINAAHLRRLSVRSKKVYTDHVLVEDAEMSKFLQEHAKERLQVRQKLQKLRVEVSKMYKISKMHLINS